MTMNDVQNPGSAIGEAIGAEMEKALHTFLATLVEVRGHHFLSKSPIAGKKKLLMFDNFGNDYNIDAVIANEAMQPIIHFASKYIHYKKHNRDKASWVCRAHPAIRRRYDSIRSSIAILAGNWSLSSRAMLKSYDINLFIVPFNRISDLLAKQGVDFNWVRKSAIKLLLLGTSIGS